jgi:hypothetical protein
VNAHAPVLRHRRFVVPGCEVRWCAMLAEALSVCCIIPGDDRIFEIRALIDAPPPVMLPMAWDHLVQAAVWWVVTCDMAGDAVAFRGQRLIETALRDKPVPVPSWAERFQ